MDTSTGNTPSEFAPPREPLTGIEFYVSVSAAQTFFLGLLIGFMLGGMFFFLKVSS